MLRLTAVLTAVLCAAPAIAQDALRPQEQLRLDPFEATAGDALLQAFQSGSADDLAALSRALSGTPQVAFDEGLAGDWSCRPVLPEMAPCNPMWRYSNVSATSGRG